VYHPKQTWKAVYQEWRSAGTGSGVTQALGLATAIIAIVSAAVIMKGGTFSPLPTLIAGSLTVLWAIISLPFAAVRVAHRETLARIDAQDALTTEQSKQPRPQIEGKIEALQKLEVAEFQGAIRTTSCWLWLYLTNAGSPSAISDWRVSVKGISGAEMECEIPYNLDTKPMRPGPPAKSIYDLQSTGLGTGEGTEVAIGFHLKGSLMAIDGSTLRVSFSDVWKNKYEIGPSPNIEIHYA
jgi:hypothetical protein